MVRERGGSGRARRRGLAAPLALPAGFGALLVIGAVAAASHGALSARWVLALVALAVLAGSLIAEPAVAPVLGIIGWLTVIGFSRPPYAELQPTAHVAIPAALVMAGCTVTGIAAGAGARRLAGSVTLWIVEVPVPPERPADSEAAGSPAARSPRRQRRLLSLTGAIGTRGVLLAGGLPLLTLALSGLHLGLGDDLLVYLVAVVAVAVVGGFWPAVIAAITASLLVNWYFTPPVHTLIISDGRSLLSLLLFITVAVTVSSVVHLAAHRARQAARSTGEAQELLALAQTVLGGADAPAAVLAHLTSGYGGRAELLERAAGQWVRVAAASAPPAETGAEQAENAAAGGGAPELRTEARADLVL